jgi:hypothetical protein
MTYAATLWQAERADGGHSWAGGRLMSDMGRREFMALLSGAAVAWPLAAQAQQPGMPVIGIFNIRSPDAMTDRLRAFRQGFKDIGYIEGESVTIRIPLGRESN